MAFYNEEYSNTRKEWISNNQVFYNSKIENAKTLEIGGLLHMYQLALENMPVNPLSPKAGEYGKVVKIFLPFSLEIKTESNSPKVQFWEGVVAVK